MNLMELIGLNTKWYRYQHNWTQETFAEKTNFKMAYISTIEVGKANLTCKNIETIASTFNIDPALLLNSTTAIEAKKLPSRVDKYIKKK